MGRTEPTRVWHHCYAPLPGPVRQPVVRLWALTFNACMQAVGSCLCATAHHKSAVVIDNR